MTDRNTSTAIKESAFPMAIDSTDSSTSVKGRITPCLVSIEKAGNDYSLGGCVISLNLFLSEDVVSERQLIFRPLLSFTNDDGEKIPGIPYEVTSGNDSIPKSSYDVVANVRLGNFHQERLLTVPERTSVGAFNYVIFD